MTLTPSDPSESKRRVFYQWLIDRMDRIGYEEIPEYYMDAWRTLDPMQLPYGFIHEWHHYWRDYQTEGSSNEARGKQHAASVADEMEKEVVEISALLCWLKMDAIQRFRHVISCIVEDNHNMLSLVYRSIDSIDPIPLRRLPDSGQLMSSISLLVAGNSCKTKRLRTILRLLHHPDQGGNSEMFMRIEESFNTLS
jgi:hypothetical protein